MSSYKQDRKNDRFGSFRKKTSKKPFVSSSLKTDEPHKLQDKWIIWGHELGNDDWSIESYKKLYEINTIEDFWIFFNNIRQFTDFMFFMMRGDILPIYEDKACTNGGFYSYVVPTAKLTNSLLLLLTRMIGETITDKETYDEIIGMSVSPKGSRSVIKIWNRNKNTKLNLYLKDTFFNDNYRYRPNSNEIQ